MILQSSIRIQPATSERVLVSEPRAELTSKFEPILPDGTRWQTQFRSNSLQNATNSMAIVHLDSGASTVQKHELSHTAAFFPLQRAVNRQVPRNRLSRVEPSLAAYRITHGLIQAPAGGRSVEGLGKRLLDG